MSNSLKSTSSLIGFAVALALLVAYVVLTVLGHDATAVLTLLVGWLGGASTPVAVAAVQGASSTGDQPAGAQTADLRPAPTTVNVNVPPSLTRTPSSSSSTGEPPQVG